MLKKILVISALLFVTSAQADEAEDKAEFNAAYQEYIEFVEASTDIDAAIESAERVYKLAPRVYGKQSEEYAIVTYNLAELYDTKGDATNKESDKDAVKYYREYFKILDSIDTPLTMDYLDKYYILTVAAHNAYGSKVNSRYTKKLIEIAEDMNLSNAEKASLNFNIAIIKVNSLVAYEAENFLDDAHDLYLVAYGADDLRVADTLFWKAKIKTAQREHDSAHEYYEEVLRIFELNFPDCKGMDSATNELMVILYETLGRSDDATKHVLKSAVEIYEENPNIKTLYQAPMIFPKDADGINEVTLEFSVDKKGRAKNITILESSNEDYNEGSIETLAKFRFSPVLSNGDFIEFYNMQYTLHYYAYTKTIPVYSNSNNYMPPIFSPGANGQQ